VRFYSKEGKQHIDLRSDLILTYDNDLIICDLKKVAPGGVHNAKYIKLAKAGVRGRLTALWLTYRFISSGRKPFKVTFLTAMWVNLSIIAAPLNILLIAWYLLR